MSTPLKNFLLLFKQEFTNKGLINTGINHIKETPTPNKFFIEPNNDEIIK